METPRPRFLVLSSQRNPQSLSPLPIHPEKLRIANRTNLATHTHARAVFFKFRAGTPLSQKETFVRGLKALKTLPSVKGGRLLVGGPSVTTPIDKSQGYEYALLSYHEDTAALHEYQVSKEHLE